MHQLDAVDLNLAPTTAIHLFSTVEWFGITVATFVADFWLNVHYGVCFILLPPLSPHPTTHLLPVHLPHTMALPKISAHLKKSAQKPLKSAFMDS